MQLCQRFFQSSKHFSNSIFRITFSSFSDTLLMSSMTVKRRPFKVLSIFGNRKKSHVAMSDEYGSWGVLTVLFLVKNSRTSNEVWAGALSWCKSHELFFHKFHSMSQSICQHHQRLLWLWFVVDYIIKFVLTANWIRYLEREFHYASWV